MKWFIGKLPHGSRRGRDDLGDGNRERGTGAVPPFLLSDPFETLVGLVHVFHVSLEKKKVGRRLAVDL